MNEYEERKKITKTLITVSIFDNNLYFQIRNVMFSLFGFG